MAILFRQIGCLVIVKRRLTGGASHCEPSRATADQAVRPEASLQPNYSIYWFFWLWFIFRALLSALERCMLSSNRIPHYIQLQLGQTTQGPACISLQSNTSDTFSNARLVSEVLLSPRNPRVSLGTSNGRRKGPHVQPPCHYSCVWF